MRDLIKKILNESKKTLVGCDFFETNTNDYRWCKFAENKLMKNTRKVTKALEDYKKELRGQKDPNKLSAILEAVSYLENLRKVLID